MKLLLDTHVWLWFVRADAALPDPFRRAIGDDDNEVVVSVVSAWEIVIKANLGKLQLGEPVESFLDRTAAPFDMLEVGTRHVRELAADAIAELEEAVAELNLVIALLENGEAKPARAARV